MSAKKGGIGITIRSYEKKGKLVVEVGNAAAIGGEIKPKAAKKKSPPSTARK